MWLTASRALGEDGRESRSAGQTSRLVWGRRFGIAASIVLLGILAIALLGGQPVEAPESR